MPSLTLTLARLALEVRLPRKSILYYARREELAAQFYPEQYPDWQIAPTFLMLIDRAGKKSINMEAGKILFLADLPELEGFSENVRGILDKYWEQVAPGDESLSERVGLRAIFLTENSTFEDLFPVFRGNTLRHEKSWVQVGGYSIRDLGFTDVHYGSEDDGLNLRIGILSPEQSKSFKKAENFEFEEGQLAVEAGCLMIDFDRYVRTRPHSEGVDAVFASFGGMSSAAERMAATVLRGT